MSTNYKYNNTRRQKPIPVPTEKVLLPSDKAALADAARLQAESKDALIRTQMELEQTQQAGMMTLDDLYAQRRRLEKIEDHGDRLHDKLDETDKLQRKLTGQWFKKSISRKDKQQQQQVDSAESDSNDQNSSTHKKTKQKKWSFLKSSTKANKEVPFLNVRKGLLDDDDATKNSIPVEYREDMDALARGDDDLDAQMDVIGNQLAGIIDLAEEMGTQTKDQGKQLHTVQHQLEDATNRHTKMTKKMRKMVNRK